MTKIEFHREPRRGDGFYYLGSKYDVCSVSRISRAGARSTYSLYAVCGGYGQYFETTV